MQREPKKEKETKVLVVCTAGEQRSPTAARLLNETDKYNAKYAGIHPAARVRVSQALIDWADLILAMNEREDRHVSFLRDHFDIDEMRVHELGIPDRFFRDDPTLIKLLKGRIPKFLDIDFD